MQRHGLEPVPGGPAPGQIAAYTPLRIVTVHVVSERPDRCKTAPNGQNHQATEQIKRLSVREAVGRLFACPMATTPSAWLPFCDLQWTRAARSPPWRRCKVARRSLRRLRRGSLLRCRLRPLYRPPGCFLKPFQPSQRRQSQSVPPPAPLRRHPSAMKQRLLRRWLHTSTWQFRSRRHWLSSRLWYQMRPRARTSSWRRWQLWRKPMWTSRQSARAKTRACRRQL